MFYSALHLTTILKNPGVFRFLSHEIPIELNKTKHGRKKKMIQHIHFKSLEIMNVFSPLSCRAVPVIDFRL